MRGPFFPFNGAWAMSAAEAAQRAARLQAEAEAALREAELRAEIEALQVIIL